MNRQTITYGQLGRLMLGGRKGAGVLDVTLGRINMFCKAHNLPALNVLAVNETTGLPTYFDLVRRDNLGGERELVYATDWYNVCPPTEADLAETNAA